MGFKSQLEAGHLALEHAVGIILAANLLHAPEGLSVAICGNRVLRDAGIVEKEPGVVEAAGLGVSLDSCERRVGPLLDLGVVGSVEIVSINESD